MMTSLHQQRKAKNKPSKFNCNTLTRKTPSTSDEQTHLVMRMNTTFFYAYNSIIIYFKYSLNLFSYWSYFSQLN